MLGVREISLRGYVKQNNMETNTNINVTEGVDD